MTNLHTFEALASLYKRRFGRLAPGKDEPMASHRDSSDEENRRQYRDWIDSGLALNDALNRVCELEELLDEAERG